MKKLLAILVLVSLCASVASANFITNGGFEDGLTGWSLNVVGPNGNEGSVFSDFAYEGDNCFQATSGNGQPDNYAYLTQALNDLAPDTTYTFSMKLRLDLGDYDGSKGIKARFVDFDAGNGLNAIPGGPTSNTDSNGQWIDYMFEFTTDANYDHGRIDILWEFGAVDGMGDPVDVGDVYIDNVSVVPEPATLALLGIGGLLGLRRKRS